ncbi:MAG TPA: hypothetical protein VGJ15_11285, partial [Pirellulales bacterium]
KIPVEWPSCTVVGFPNVQGNICLVPSPEDFLWRMAWAAPLAFFAVLAAVKLYCRFRRGRIA